MKSVVMFFLIAFAVHVQASDVREQCMRFKSMPQENLDQMYLEATPGKIPQGVTQGCVIGWPQTLLNLPITSVMNTVWTGKVFDGNSSTLKNRVLGLQAVKADVYIGKSLLDGAPSIIVDYSNEIYPFSLIRDEIREVSPGVYLGRAYIRTIFGTVLGVNFALFQ